MDVEARGKLFIVNYKSQSTLWKVGTPLQLRVLCQSRGTIYERGTYRCVCLAFLKFWCVGEQAAADIQDKQSSHPSSSSSTATTPTHTATTTPTSSTATTPTHTATTTTTSTTAAAAVGVVGGSASGGLTFAEKLDGSLLKVFFYGGEWVLASNSKLDTLEQRQSLGGRSHRQLFEEAAAASGQPTATLEANMMARGGANVCFMFERLHPENIIVVPHTMPRLVHVGTRCMQTLNELEVDIGIEKPALAAFATIRECANAAATIPWNRGEGQ